jgi:hypothetical protein
MNKIIASLFLALATLAAFTSVATARADVHAKKYPNWVFETGALTLGGKNRCVTFQPVVELYPAPAHPAVDILLHATKEQLPQSKTTISGNYFLWSIEENGWHNLPYGDVYEIFLTRANPVNGFPTTTFTEAVQFFPFGVDDVNITPRVTPTSVLRRGLILTCRLDSSVSDAFITVDNGVGYTVLAGESLLITWDEGDSLDLSGYLYLGRTQGGKGTFQIRPVVVGPEFYTSYTGNWELVYQTDPEVGPE